MLPVEEEFGDLFFAVINAARLYGVNPENALEHTNRKFISRFNPSGVAPVSRAGTFPISRLWRWIACGMRLKLRTHRNDSLYHRETEVWSRYCKNIGCQRAEGKHIMGWLRVAWTFGHLCSLGTRRLLRRVEVMDAFRIADDSTQIRHQIIDRRA